MCGIAGGIFRGGRIAPTTARDAIAAMVDALRHRGPDGSGIYDTADNSIGNTIGNTAAVDASGPHVVLGHTRLAILDVTSAGSQPMLGPRRDLAVTYNGEIYNFAELKGQLANRAGFTSRSDTEVLLRAYETWGIGALSRLRGMFAFALWDANRRRLLLARDRFGIKPLYYFRNDGFLIFASEVRALLASGLVPRRLDATALWQYLGYQSVPGPRTLVEGVRLLDPGSWMSIDEDGSAQSGQYWDMLAAGSTDASTGDEDAAIADDSSHVRETAERLRDAIRCHLVSDRPVGAFLSGGIDSSAVVALMREAGCTPRTISVGFREQSFDESRFAKIVATKFATDHTHIELDDATLLEQLPCALGAMDQPTGDGVNTYVISRAVRAHGVTVALSGLGGDEIFGGYPSFTRLSRLAGASSVWSRTPESVRGLAASAVRHLGGASIATGKAAAMLETDGSVASTFPIARQLLSVADRASLLDPDVLAAVERESDPYERLLADAFERHPGAGMFTRVSFAESRTYMHDVLLRDADQMSMAHGLEIRVPLIDHQLVEGVASVPERSKWPNGIPKRLLVESLGDLLPPEIVHRPKQGFTLPFEPWMRGALRGFCEHRLGEDGLAGRGLFEPHVLRARWQSFLDGASDTSWSRLWVLVVLDAWLDRHAISWT